MKKRGAQMNGWIRWHLMFNNMSEGYSVSEHENTFLLLSEGWIRPTQQCPSIFS